MSIKGKSKKYAKKSAEYAGIGVAAVAVVAGAIVLMAAQSIYDDGIKQANAQGKNIPDAKTRAKIKVNAEAAAQAQAVCMVCGAANPMKNIRARCSKCMAAGCGY